MLRGAYGVQSGVARLSLVGAGYQEMAKPPEIQDPIRLETEQIHVTGFDNDGQDLHCRGSIRGFGDRPFPDKFQ